LLTDIDAEQSCCGGWRNWGKPGTSSGYGERDSNKKPLEYDRMIATTVPWRQKLAAYYGKEKIEVNVPLCLSTTASIHYVIWKQSSSYS